MTPADYPDFRSANERYLLICASTCVANNPPDWQSRRLIMPVKYSIVKDLDCISNRLSGQAQRVVDLVGLGGIEPPTSPLSGVRSSHLSYRPGQQSPVWQFGDLHPAAATYGGPIRLDCFDPAL